MTVTFRAAQPGTTYWTTYDSPLGELLLVGDGQSLTGLYLGAGHRHARLVQPAWLRDPEPFEEVTSQLDEYLAGGRTDFELAVAPLGTPFQLAVWQALTEIGYGQTASYGGLATRIGRPRASRAVGLANGRNPVSVIVPCHRVVGAAGGLVGYGGGLENKRWLLTHERATAPNGLLPVW